MARHILPGHIFPKSFVLPTRLNLDYCHKVLGGSRTRKRYCLLGTLAGFVWIGCNGIIVCQNGVTAKAFRRGGIQVPARRIADGEVENSVGMLDPIINGRVDGRSWGFFFQFIYLICKVKSGGKGNGRN